MNLKSIQHGTYAGLAGGVVFGAMMGMMGMLPMIGQMAGVPSAAAGFILHLAISAFIGGSFAVLFNNAVTSTGSGLGIGAAYGAAWWVLGPLTLMPLMMGMGVNWNLTAATAMLPSLVGHIIYGLILGATYARLRSRIYPTQPSSATA
jgi:uncharacterized membrane protein YagU involved in acid resistance